MKHDPRFQYLKEHGTLAVDQERRSDIGAVYKIVAIEKSGYVLCRKRNGETVRLWCDRLEAWQRVS